MPRSPEGRRVVRELRKELRESGRQCGRELSFSAVEEQLIAQIADLFDRKHDLQADYLACEDVEMKLRLSSEMRQIQAAAERMLRRICTEAPAVEAKVAAVPSRVSKQATRAVQQRWARTKGGM